MKSLDSPNCRSTWASYSEAWLYFVLLPIESDKRLRHVNANSTWFFSLRMIGLVCEMEKRVAFVTQWFWTSAPRNRMKLIIII